MIFKASPKRKSLEVCEFTGDIVEMQEFGKPFIIGDTTLFFNGSAGPIVIQHGNFIVKLSDGNLQLYTRENFYREFTLNEYIDVIFTDLGQKDEEEVHLEGAHE